MIRLLNGLFSASMKHPPTAPVEPEPEEGPHPLVDVEELRRDVDMLMRAEKSRQGRERAAARWGGETPHVEEKVVQRAAVGQGGILRRGGA